MSDIPDIEPGEGGEAIEPPAEAVIGAAVAAGAALACLSCGAKIVGAWCANCGQKNDDMRRSVFVLFKDFIKDTFSFDSRMWRTLGLMAAAPGRVPTDYSHGKRSRYTPPVRLFLVVSFLFFLILGLTQTLFVAFDVKAKTPAEIAAEKQRTEEALAELPPEARAAVEAAGEDADGLVVIDGESVDCDINVKVRFFVHPKDLALDADN